MTDDLDNAGRTSVWTAGAVTAEIEALRQIVARSSPGQLPHSRGQRVLSGFLDAAERLTPTVRRLDELPFSPTRVGEAATHRLYQRRRDAAAKNPTWAAIQALRNPRPDGTATLLSDDLSWDHFRQQHAIERSAAPDPWWAPAARHAQALRARTGWGYLLRGTQRLARGWDDIEAYNMASALPQRIGEQLLWLTERGHGWPGEHHGYPTVEHWHTEVLAHARTLLTAGWGSPAAHEELRKAWLTAARRRDHATNTFRGVTVEDTTQVEEAAAAARQALDAAESAAEQAVRASMHWVADNLNLLWD